MGLICVAAHLKNLATKKWRCNFARIAMLLSMIICTGNAAHAEEPFVSVCDRSEVIERVLVNLIQKPCDLITRKDLNYIESYIEVNSSLSLPRIKTGDLNDLKNLRGLFLLNSNIEVIEAGAFKDLLKLHVLSLSHNLLEDLDPKVFEGLVNLSSLSLRGNRIKKLHRDIFGETPRLKDLDLSFNKLSFRDNEFLKGTKGLTHFNIARNGWTEVTPGYFDDLTIVETILLGGLDLQFVPDRMFINFQNLQRVNINDSPLKQTSRAALVGIPEVTGLPSNFGNSQSGAEGTWD